MKQQLHRREVQLIHWPTEKPKRDWCRKHHVPRVLLVAPGAAPPETSDIYEDWVRPPLPERDLAARIDVVGARRERFDHPRLVSPRELVFRGSRVTMSKGQATLANVFVQNYRNVVPRSTLLEQLSTVAAPSNRRNVLDLHITRLRRKVEVVGLEVKTYWGSGYQLEPGDDLVGGTLVPWGM